MDRTNSRWSVGYLLASLLLVVAGCATSSASTESESSGAESTGSAADAEPEYAESEVIPVDDSPIRGPSDAEVTIVEFADFQCPYCKQGWKRMKRIRENYPDRVRVVLKHFPLSMHENARPAAHVALAAGEQGDEYLWKMHDRLYEQQAEWAEGDVRKMAVRWAEEMGLDVDQFEQDLEQNRDAFNRRIQKDRRLGVELEVEGVPHFFVNGERVDGVYDYSRFEKVVDARIDEVEKLREDGTAAEKLYRRAVRNNYESKSSDSGGGDSPDDGGTPDEGGEDQGDYL